MEAIKTETGQVVLDREASENEMRRRRKDVRNRRRSTEEDWSIEAFTKNN